MNIAELTTALEAGLRLQSESDGSWKMRRDALDAFARQGFPSRRNEDWKYTDLKPIVAGAFDCVPGIPGEGDRQSAMDRVSSLSFIADATRLAFIDGRRVDVGEPPPLPEGLELLDQREAWRCIGSTQSEEQFRNHPLTAINTAFSQDCTLIRVRANADISRPLHLVFLGGTDPGSAVQARVLIDMGRNSRLRIIQHFVAGDGGWTNSVTQATQEAGSQLEIYRFQEHTLGHFHTELLEIELARDATARLDYVDLGGRLVRNDLRVRLAERGASCDVSGVFLAALGQHVDNHTRIDHAAPDTTSNEAFRGIVGERGRGVFNGKVVVHDGARGTDARQSSDNLLLSPRGEVNTKPELEIYNDDVKCTHGATVGELDADQLFYLRSRGMDAESARGLLVFAFANELLSRIAIPELRQRVVTAVAGNLPDHKHRGDLP